jgi:hypothetical protein
MRWSIPQYHAAARDSFKDGPNIFNLAIREGFDPSRMPFVQFAILPYVLLTTVGEIRAAGECELRLKSSLYPGKFEVGIPI